MAVEPMETTKRNAIALIGGKERRKIVIARYSPAWPRTFQHHASVIQRVLGNIALRIEHIGSTSVPGLAAKPIVDILVVVHNPADETSYVPALLSAGYELRVRDASFDDHRMFRTPEHDVHIHVFPPTSHEVDRYLVFRDHLRTHATDRAWYERIKRELAARGWQDMNEYANAKSHVVEAIIRKALQARGKGASA